MVPLMLAQANHYPLQRSNTLAGRPPWAAAVGVFGCVVVATIGLARQQPDTVPMHILSLPSLCRCLSGPLPCGTRLSLFSEVHNLSSLCSSISLAWSGGPSGLEFDSFLYLLDDLVCLDGLLFLFAKSLFALWVLHLFSLLRTCLLLSVARTTYWWFLKAAY
ncbi:unnamed protein product [Urochloa decumbens]|uniref:Uncharacterized protein n=1 Tax=Urochloa decumbens TaxID=240449 RepID=A0ABC9EB62_9POAL